MTIPDEYKKDIDRAVSILKEHGCDEIYIFGSLAEDNAVSARSDIDIAVRGIPKTKFFAIYGRLMTSLEHSVDLVSLDIATPFTRILLEKGTLRRVA